MNRVNTVTGQTPAEALGTTALHEHLIADTSFSGNDPDKILDDEDAILSELIDLGKAGVDTVVDLTPEAIGRDVHALQRLAERSGLHIVCATGLYREPAYPAYVKEATVDQLARRMIDEITRGIERTSVKAGVIGEIATEWNAPISPLQDKVFRASARAAVETGVGVACHCWAGWSAPEMLAVFKEEGLSGERVLIAHVAGVETPEETTRRILDAGAAVGVESIGERLDACPYGPPIRSDAGKVDEIVRLIDAGHLDQISVSMDACKKHHLKRNGGPGYDAVFTRFVPMLKQAGLTDAHLDAIFVTTPRRVLAGA